MKKLLLGFALALIGVAVQAAQSEILADTSFISVTNLPKAMTNGAPAVDYTAAGVTLQNKFVSNPINLPVDTTGANKGITIWLETWNYSFDNAQYSTNTCVTNITLNFLLSADGMHWANTPVLSFGSLTGGSNSTSFGTRSNQSGRYIAFTNVAGTVLTGMKFIKATNIVYAKTNGTAAVQLTNCAAWVSWIK